LHHGTDFQSDAAGQARRERRAPQHHPPRAIDLKAHQVPPAARGVARGDLVFGDAEPRHVLLRKVNAVLAEVDFHILPEVDELQRRADRVRASVVAIVVFAVEVQHQAPDGVGRAAAIVHHLGKARVALLGDVLRERIEEIVEGR